MRSHNQKITTWLAIVGFAFCNSSSGAFAATLFGGVSHSDVLPAVDPVASAPPQQAQPQPQQSQPEAISPTIGGSARATVQNPAIEWFPIPRWMAGQWTKNGDLTKTVTDLRTGITSPVNEFIEDRMTVTWGFQTDSQGNIWHAHFIPSERDGESQGKNVSFLIYNLKVIEATPENLATRTHYIVKESLGRQVTDVFQQESLTHYALAGGPNRMDALSSNRVFSYQGQPKRDGAMISHYERIANFRPVAFKQGVDLAASLNQYLRTHNMEGLAKQVQAITPAQQPMQSFQQAQPMQSFQQAQQPTQSFQQAQPMQSFQQAQPMQSFQQAQPMRSFQQTQPSQPLNRLDVNDPLRKIDPNNPF